MFRKAKKLKNPHDAEHGYNYALFLLGLRSRTRGEIEKKMQDRGYAKTVIDQALQKLADFRYINDDDYLRNFIENQKEFGSHGYFWLKQKLVLRNVSSEVAEAALQQQFSEEDELAVLSKFITKEFRGKQLADMLYPDKQKLAAKCARRGFRQSLVRRLIFD